MADVGSFPEKTTFTTSVQADTAEGTAYGYISFSFDRGDYPEIHPADSADLADGIRDFLESRGYTVTPFIGNLSAELDWPEAV